MIDIIEDDKELNTILDDMTAYNNDVEMLLGPLSVKKSPVRDHRGGLVV